ncbi:MAG: hypothetical protein KC588_00640 [Nitrospira sp.]|nr:hypothetical protein [Nitrospira sp.]
MEDGPLHDRVFIGGFGLGQKDRSRIYMQEGKKAEKGLLNFTKKSCRSRPTNQTFTFSTVCLVALVGASCASSTPPTVVCGVCEESGRYVRVQIPSGQISTGLQGSFSHPLNLSPQDWKQVLAVVRIRPYVQRFGVFSRKGDEKPVFDQEEIDHLSLALSRAFPQARAQEWVVFSLSRPDSTYGTEMTTGAWFARDTTLHLLLANYRATVRLSNRQEAQDQDPLFRIQRQVQYEFVENGYARIPSDNKSLLSLLLPQTPHLIIEYQQLLEKGLAASNDAPMKRPRTPCQEPDGRQVRGKN